MTPETTAAPDSSTKGQASSLPRWHAAAGATPLTMYGWRGKGHLPALLRRPFEPGEYTAALVRQVCARLGITQSMGRPGSALDNAVIESWHSTLEFELRSVEHFATRAAARARVPAWIEDYNRHRRHSALGMMSPVDYEQALKAGKAA